MLHQVDGLRLHIIYSECLHILEVKHVLKCFVKSGLLGIMYSCTLRLSEHTSSGKLHFQGAHILCAKVNERRMTQQSGNVIVQ